MTMIKYIIALIILEEIYTVLVYARILPDTFHLLEFMRKYPPVFMNPRIAIAILTLGLTAIIAIAIYSSLAAN